jgi:hypothetical protein
MEIPAASRTTVVKRAEEGEFPVNTLDSRQNGIADL